MSDQAEIQIERTDDRQLRIKLAGSWRGRGGLAAYDQVAPEIESGSGAARVAFDAAAVTDWDSGLLTFLTNVINRGRERGLEVDPSGLPDGVQRLLNLASAVPEKKTAREEAPTSVLERIGAVTVAACRGAVDLLAFIGETTVAFVKLLRGKARFRRIDFMITLQECGFEALPIVFMITFLNGVVLAFVGAVQLSQIGGQIFVADLVGVATTRAMGAMMAAIVMAGRTGAAFAAQLGTMTANEEIDALKTMGISPIEFLVLPRVLGLALMMPLLCVYADLAGITGGILVGITLLDLNPAQYLIQTQAAVRMTDFLFGLSKSVVFGVLIAMSGCLRGIQCGRSASAVGQAATSAVVTSIAVLIVADAVFSVVSNILGI